MSNSLHFQQPPSAWRAYRRVLIGSRPGLKDAADMPEIEATWNDVKVDFQSLEAYRELCEIQGEPGLPIHYPHVLVSPMHLNILTEPEFPLKLMGAVHLRNHVVRYRSIRSDENLDLRATLGRARFRPQGIEFDLDTVMKVQGETVWAERTTFLVRKKKKTENPPSPLQEFFAWNEEVEGEEILRFKVPKTAGRQYAKVTGDYNPIHISKGLAKVFGFKRDLVHGMWGVARATCELEELKNEEPVRFDIAFKGPLFMEHEVRVEAQDIDGGRNLRLYCGKESRPAVLMTVRRVEAGAKPEAL